jgi:hypothetical protein
MRRSFVVALVVAVTTLLALPAIAAAVWGATPHYAARELVTHYRTPDGHNNVSATCIGVKSSRLKRRGFYHRFGCGQTDDVGRVWGVTVVVHNPHTGPPLTVTVRTCDASHASIPCP